MPPLLLALAALSQAAPTPPDPAALRAAADYSDGFRGRAVVVLFDGAVVFERYANGGGRDVPQMLASGSKSFVGVAAAAAVRDGLLKIEDPASAFLPEWAADPLKANVTLGQLLTLTSGLTAGERSFRRQPGWEDMAARPMTGRPGGQFAYGANQLNVFALALERALGGESFEAYLDRRVLDPIGATVDWRVRCADGRPQVGGGAFATARDWAAFGEFVRRGGRPADTGMSDPPLVDPAALAAGFQGTAANPAYGRTWWLRRPVPAALRRTNRIVASEWADAADAGRLPADLVAALGAGKQRLYIIPSRKLVIVRLAAFGGRGFSDLRFLDLILNGPPDSPAEDR